MDIKHPVATRREKIMQGMTINARFSIPTDIELFDPNWSEVEFTCNFFFFNPQFSNKTVLMAWEHEHFPAIITELLSRYFPPGSVPKVPDWPDDDYDTIWTVTLDAAGNLTVNNALCEGIDSAKLPATAPQFR